MTEENLNQGQGDTGAGGTENTGSATTGEWTQALSEDLRGHDALQGLDGFDALAKQYVELKTSQPAIPESADGYEYKFPDGLTVDQEAFDAFRAKALEAEMTPEQFKTVMDAEMERSQQWQQAMERQRDQATEEMRKEFGKDFDAKLALANRVLERFGGKDMVQQPDPGNPSQALGNSPAFFRFLISVGDVLSEKALETHAREGGEPDTRPRDANTGQPRLYFPSMDGKK